jgi:hypothetical protein
MIIHLGESSNYASTDKGEFWSLSEYEWMGEMVQICLFKFYFFKQPILYTFLNRILQIYT